MSVRCVLKDVGPGLGEGPCWWKERGLLLWVQINKSKVGLFDPKTSLNRFLDLPARVGAVVPTSEGDLLAATASGFLRIDPDSGTITQLMDPEADKEGNRFNDGKCDPWGRFWAGTMAYNFEGGAGSLWRLDPNGKVSLQRSNVTCSNGLAWSIDRKKMYYIDSPTLQVVAFQLNEDGEIVGEEPAVCIRIPEDWGCVPDGMTIDAEGKLWICLFDGSSVTRWDPDTGALLRRLELPCKKVTSCTFGGEHLEKLYITTCRWDEDTASQPLAGCLFEADVGVKGLPTEYFRVEKAKT